MCCVGFTGSVNDWVQQIGHQSGVNHLIEARERYNGWGSLGPFQQVQLIRNWLTELGPTAEVGPVMTPSVDHI